jgi:hypothetical protein
MQGIGYFQNLRIFLEIVWKFLGFWGEFLGIFGNFLRGFFGRNLWEALHVFV